MAYLVSQARSRLVGFVVLLGIINVKSNVLLQPSAAAIYG